MRINYACPNCSTPMEIPGAFHGCSDIQMHTHRECSRCGRPLIWFARGPLATGWRIDDAEERRRAHAAQYAA
jgi:endogenous inhibitor of DNA gyrase (YacG/DUF329 family)